MSAVVALSVCGDSEMAESAVVVAKVVLGLASSFVRTEVGRWDDFVVDVDHAVVAFDGRDRDATRVRGTAASLGDFEGQRDGMRFAHRCTKHLQRLGHGAWAAQSAERVRDRSWAVPTPSGAPRRQATLVGRLFLGPRPSRRGANLQTHLPEASLRRVYCSSAQVMIEIKIRSATVQPRADLRNARQPDVRPSLPHEHAATSAAGAGRLSAAAPTPWPTGAAATARWPSRRRRTSGVRLRVARRPQRSAVCPVHACQRPCACLVGASARLIRTPRWTVIRVRERVNDLTCVISRESRVPKDGIHWALSLLQTVRTGSLSVDLLQRHPTGLDQ